MMPALLWLGAIGAAMWWQFRYETTPGDAAIVPTRWPDRCPLPHNPGRGTAIMALHPRCPCSRASVTELEQFARSAEADIFVLVTVPTGAGPEWTTTGLCAQAGSIPGVTLVLDPQGRLASTFGMRTSGHVVLYDGAGALAFSGGITASRGQIGPNAGLASLEALTQADQARPAEVHRQSPIYGCELVGPVPTCKENGT
jgi:hypothetical protein